MNYECKLTSRNSNNFPLTPPSPPLHYRYRYGRFDSGAGLNLHPESRRSVSRPLPTPATRARAQKRQPRTQSARLSPFFDARMDLPQRPAPPPRIPRLCELSGKQTGLFPERVPVGNPGLSCGKGSRDGERRVRGRKRTFSGR
jgi:hypothetical protein